MRTISAAILLSFGLTAAAAMHAPQAVVELQAGTVRALAGDVTDPTGATISNVAVTLLTEDGKAAASTKTDDQGHFSLTAPAPQARYRLRFEAPGFKQLIVTVSLNPRLHRLIHAQLPFAQ